MEKIIISILSTDAVIALIVGAFVTYLVKWLATKDREKFKQYEGFAITAIKAAEKAIPDDAPLKGARKLDFALKAFLTKYQSATGVQPSDEMLAKIESWIATIHSALEEANALRKAEK